MMPARLYHDTLFRAIVLHYKSLLHGQINGVTLCDIDITLGQGAFGKVVRAEAVGIIEAEEKTVVAVKMVRGKFLPFDSELMP